jgi:hypothetical protein
MEIIYNLDKYLKTVRLLNLPDNCVIRKNGNKYNIYPMCPSDEESQMYFKVKRLGLMEEFLHYGRFLIYMQEKETVQLQAWGGGSKGLSG